MKLKTDRQVIKKLKLAQSCDFRYITYINYVIYDEAYVIKTHRKMLLMNKSYISSEYIKLNYIIKTSNHNEILIELSNRCRLKLKI